MFTFIKNWFRDLELQRKQKDFDRGYNWAALELAKGTPEAVIEMYTQCGEFRSCFDKGAEEALRDWSFVCKNRDSLAVGN